MRITLLCGGVGGSKLAVGLYEEFPEADLRIVVNIADDLTFAGLHISPDLDTVTYTLAGIVNSHSGWGIEADTFEALDMLGKYGEETWFRIGDRDLATHLFRTARIASGATLTDITAEICKRLGVRAHVLPMCDQRVSTRIRVRNRWLTFQEYFVKYNHRDQPTGIEYDGIESAQLSGAAAEAIHESDLLVVAPSNPVLSIGPILAVPGALECLQSAKSPKIAVSPIIGSESATGPAGKLMLAAGFDSSVVGLADMYQAWVNLLVIHVSDEKAMEAIHDQGVRPLITDILMPDLVSKRKLARFVVEAA